MPLGRPQAVPPGEDVIACAPDGKEVVETESQGLDQGEKCVESEPTVAGLCLGDGTGRDAGQAGQIGLAEPALLAHPAQAGAQAAEGFLLLEARCALRIRPDMQQAALYARPALRLDHP